jgi:hypothetical protein
MRIDTDFHTAYRELEIRMKALAVADGDVFLPNPEPEAPVGYVFICMEPSRSWAGSAEEAEAKVDAGFRNFLCSIDVQILHFCIRSYLCKSTPRYHITDFSKGAMFVQHARRERNQRWDRWYPLLQEEINLVAPSDAAIVAVGSEVFRHLKRLRFQRRFTQIIHYSPLAGRARNAGIVGHEESFKEFNGSVSLDDLVATAKRVFEAARVPAEIRDEALSRLRGSQLTTSRQKLIFIYKLAFESMRRGWPGR